MFVNIAGYRFVDLPDRDNLGAPFREKYQPRTKGNNSPKPQWNQFLSGRNSESINDYVSFLEEDSRLTGIPMHITYSEYQYS